MYLLIYEKASKQQLTGTHTYTQNVEMQKVSHLLPPSPRFLYHDKRYSNRDEYLFFVSLRSEALNLQATHSMMKKLQLLRLRLKSVPQFPCL